MISVRLTPAGRILSNTLPKVGDRISVQFLGYGVVLELTHSEFDNYIQIKFDCGFAVGEDYSKQNFTFTLEKDNV